MFDFFGAVGLEFIFAIDGFDPASVQLAPLIQPSFLSDVLKVFLVTEFV